MNATAITPIWNVTSVPESIAWFEKLGWARCWTYNDGGLIHHAADANANGPANFAAVGSGCVEIFLCSNGQGARDPRKPEGIDDGNTYGATWLSLWLPTPADVDAAYERAKVHGIVVPWPPVDEPWGVRECRIWHPDGHVMRLSSGLSKH